MQRTQGLIPNRKRVYELRRYYNAMANQLKDDLLMLDVKTFKETKAMSLQKKVDSTVRRMNRFSLNWSYESAPEAYRQAAMITRTSLDILGAKKNMDFDNKIHSQSIEKGGDITASVLLKANKSINVNIGTYIYLIRQAAKTAAQIQAFDLRSEEIISKLLDKTIRAGGSRQDLMRLIRIHFKREIYQKKFINISGRNYNLISYAETVARTRLRIIQSEAVKNLCAQYDNDLIEISDHGTDCIICIPWEGNIYSISGKHPIYPYLEAWPPFHPRCEHSAGPTSEEAIAVRGGH